MDKPLNVTHVTFGLDVGGLEKMLLQFAQHHDPSRVKPSFVSLGEAGPVGDSIRSLGLPVVCLHRSEGFRPDLFFALRRAIKYLDADVVHTHDARALIYGSPAARMAGVSQVIHTQHGQNLGLSGRQQWLLRRASRFVSHYLGVSGDAAALASQIGVPEEKIATLHNGVDLEAFAPPADSADAWSQRTNLLCVARLSEEKGLATLLAAVSVAADAAPDLTVEIAGEGPCRAALEQQAHRLKIADRVTFLGQIDDVPAAMSRAKLFVLPSDSEGISLTLLEAMASGVAIVATRVGGTPEVIRHQETGLLVEPSQPAEMAAALAQLWTDPVERSRLADAARESVERRFDIRGTISAYEALYAGAESLDTVTSDRLGKQRQAADS